jgi:hypothetical protein
LEELEKDRAAGRTVNAASLYRKFIERWLHRDDGKHVFTPAHKLRLMENLAAALWRENARTWRWERVEEWLETFLYENPVISSALAGHPITILQQDFRTATFFLRPDACAESLRFAHTSIQEYFLARHLAHALETSDFSAWDVPAPSRETFDFLAQHLLTLNGASKTITLANVAFLFGNAELPEAIRLNALRYYEQGHAQYFPIHEIPALDCSGLDLAGWEFHGTALRPLTFGKVSFNCANLSRASFKHVNFAPGAEFCDTDLQATDFCNCNLTGAEFCTNSINGANFSQCDLTGVSRITAREINPFSPTTA